MDSDAEDLDITFDEPEGYFDDQAKPHTFDRYTLRDGRLVRLRLVGHNPLWGHLLWNGGKVLAGYLEQHVDQLVRGRRVLELGAGGGLPSLVCASHEAREVLVTDYPDEELVDNLRHNIGHALEDTALRNVQAMGHLWGAALPSEQSPNHFDLILLADLLFNHSCHASLLKSITDNLALTASARALVFFTPYRPWLLDKDLAFFDLVRAEHTGLQVDELGQWQMDSVMFDKDPGDETLRRTVFGFAIRWQASRLA